jgi:ubiquinone biosynthesis protein
VDERLNNRSPPDADPMAGLRGSVLAGSCILGGVIAVVQGGPLWLSLPLFVIGGLLALFAK